MREISGYERMPMWVLRVFTAPVVVLAGAGIAVLVAVGVGLMWWRS